MPGFVALISAAHASVVWLSYGLRSPGTARAGRGSRGVCSARSSVALPARQPSRFEDRRTHEQERRYRGSVVIGMDPHKRSVTIEVMTADEAVVGGGRFGTDRDGLRRDAGATSRRGRTGSGRSRAATASAGTSRTGCSPTASRSSTCRRSCRRGRGCSPPVRAARPTPPTPTRSRWSAPGWPGCVRWSPTSSSTVLRLLVDRRRSLGEEHTRKISQLHQLLLELIPGGAKKYLSAAQAKALLAKVRPRDVGRQDPQAGRRRAGRRPRADLRRARRPPNKELTELVAATGTSAAGPARHRPLRRRPAAGRGRRHHPVPRPQPLRVLERHRTRSTPPPATTSATGCPAAGTGRSTGSCTSWPPSSSATPPKAAPTTTARRPPGKTSMEAMRCLKRRLSDIVYRTMLDDAIAAGTGDGPGRATGQRL